LSHSENRGLASARNTGVFFSKGDYVAFLDNDIAVDPDWLAELVDAIQKGEDVGVAMSLTYDLLHPDRLQCAGQKILPFIGWTISIGYGELAKRRALEETEVFACLNAALVKRETFMSLGGIDVNMTYLWEDIDFEWRVWLSGMKEILVPSSRVFHLPKTPGQRERTYRWRINRDDFLSKDALKFMIKNYEVGHILTFVPFAFAILSTRAGLGLVRRRDTSLVVSLLRAILSTIATFRSILISRSQTQRLRTVTDDQIFAKVGDKSLSTLIEYHTRVQRVLRSLSFIPKSESW
jgi:GT2 family glycosyltransferase